jgi:hypothetical protein
MSKRLTIVYLYDIMTEQKIKEIDEILLSGKPIMGWCCVCGMPITNGEWVLIAKVKHDDTYKKGFRIDNIKRHSECGRD